MVGPSVGVCSPNLEGTASTLRGGRELGRLMVGALNFQTESAAVMALEEMDWISTRLSGHNGIPIEGFAPSAQLVESAVSMIEGARIFLANALGSDGG